VVFIAKSLSQDFDRIIHFFDESLRENSPCRMQEEYPLVFDSEQSSVVLIDPKDENSLSGKFITELDPQKKSHIFMIEENSELKAGLATLIREIQVDSGKKMRFLFIGSVVTKPQYRQQGLQRELFLALEKSCSQLKIDVLALWSNQILFYQKLGFFFGGLQATWIPRFPFRQTKPSFDVAYGMSYERPFSEKHFKAFNQKKFRVERTCEEMERLWKSPQMFVASTEQAYALMGRGEDFQGICHEWAGPPDEVLCCIHRLRQEARDLKVLSPGVLHDEEEQDVVQKLENEGFEPRFEYLGLFKLMNAGIKASDFDPESLKYSFFIWGLDSI